MLHTYLSTINNHNINIIEYFTYKVAIYNSIIVKINSWKYEKNTIENVNLKNTSYLAGLLKTAVYI